MSTISQLLEQRELNVQALAQNRKDQEENFTKNAPAVVSQIASSIFKSLKNHIETALLNPKKPIFESKIYGYTHYVTTSEDSSPVNNLFIKLAGKTAELSPINEWSQGIHYYTKKEMESNPLFGKFKEIWDAVEVILTEKLTQYKMEPGNEAFSFEIIKPFDELGLNVKLMLDLNQKKNNKPSAVNVPPAVPEDSGFWGFFGSHTKKD